MDGDEPDVPTMSQTSSYWGGRYGGSNTHQYISFMCDELKILNPLKTLRHCPQI